MRKSELFKTVGILGGMGAEAGVELHRRVILATGARTDAEQVPCILFTNPALPDRPAFIEGRGPDPFDDMLESFRMLVQAGAEVLAMPCNTAHIWHERLQPELPAPIVHMIRETVRAHDRSIGTAVGVLCTSGTTKAGIYQKCCAEAGLTAVTSTPDEARDLVMRAIYGDLERGFIGLKGGNKSEEIVDLMHRAGELLMERGAQALWLACTEISLIRDELQERAPVPVVDALDVLAESIVRDARGQSRVSAAEHAAK